MGIKISKNCFLINFRHKTHGYHHKLHKDEFKKEHKFYDDFHEVWRLKIWWNDKYLLHKTKNKKKKNHIEQGGNHEKHGHKKAHHSDHEGHFKKGKSHHSGKHHDKKGKKVICNNIN